MAFGDLALRRFEASSTQDRIGADNLLTEKVINS